MNPDNPRKQDADALLDEWRLTTWPDGHQCEKHYVDGQYTGEFRNVTDNPTTEEQEDIDLGRVPPDLGCNPTTGEQPPSRPHYTDQELRERIGWMSGKPLLFSNQYGMRFILSENGGIYLNISALVQHDNPATGEQIAQQIWANALSGASREVQFNAAVNAINAALAAAYQKGKQDGFVQGRSKRKFNE